MNFRTATFLISLAQGSDAWVPAAVVRSPRATGYSSVAQAGARSGTTRLHSSEDVDMTADVSIPYDAAAKLAYEAGEENKSMDYQEFKEKYEAEAVALVKSKQAGTVAEKTPAAEAIELVKSKQAGSVKEVESVDVSIPYDAAAKLAYEASDKSMAYSEFKTQFEAEAIELVKSKQAGSVEVVESVNVSIPYDAAAELAYEASDKSMAYAEFKTKYEAEAIELVKSKQAGSVKEEKEVDVPLPSPVVAAEVEKEVDVPLRSPAAAVEVVQDEKPVVVIKEKVVAPAVVKAEEKVLPSGVAPFFAGAEEEVVEEDKPSLQLIEPNVPAQPSVQQAKSILLHLGAVLDRGQAYNPTSGEYYSDRMQVARDQISAFLEANPDKVPKSMEDIKGEWELVLSTVPHGIFRSSPFFLAIQEAFDEYAEVKEINGMPKSQLFFKLHELQTMSWGASKVGRVAQHITEDYVYSEFDTSIFSMTVIPIVGWFKLLPTFGGCVITAAKANLEEGGILKMTVDYTTSRPVPGLTGLGEWIWKLKVPVGFFWKLFPWNKGREALCQVTIRYCDDDFRVVEDRSGDMFVYARPVLPRSLDLAEA